MRFSAIHKAASYLMIAAAFATLALSRELSPQLIGLTLAAAVASYPFEPARHALLRSRGWTAAWNAVSLAMFVFSLVDAVRGDALPAGVRFLCFLIVNKLWNRKSSRDYMQAYVVSFLMLVAGAALNNDLAYAGCFFAYVVFATWTLTLFHLRREMEENYLIKHSDDGAERVEVDRILNSRRIVGWSFLGTTSLVSLGVFIGATLVFFLIPRFGFGFFANHSRHGVMTTGFSDRVDLDHYGLVKDNPQVVMRVEFPGTVPVEPLRFRGVAFDRYERGRWSRTLTQASLMRHWGELSFIGESAQHLTGPRVRSFLQRALQQRIYLDPLDTAVLFGAARAVAFEMPSGNGLGPAPVSAEPRPGDEVYAVERRFNRDGGYNTVERRSGLRYTVYSDLTPPDERILRLAPDADADDEDLAPYLQLPPDLPPRVAELARTITRNANGPWQKAQLIAAYLARYKYTLDLKRNEKYEPLEDFLFVQKAGHCEYFASALAVLLRVVGVPTRSVNGFLGGEWNDYGHYLAVRQGDAHSWVEVWIDGAGWLTMDPTPPGAALPVHNSSWTQLRQLADNLELVWFKYVVEYDLGKQVELFGSVRRWTRRSSQHDSLDLALRKRAAPVVGGIGLLAGSWLLLRAWRRRKLPEVRIRHGAEALHAYARALKALERRGFARGSAETGRELAVRVERAADPVATPFSELVELYYAARFGNVEVAQADLERLAHSIATTPAVPEPPATA